MANLEALSATLDSAILFTIGPLHLTPPITQYEGESFYITDFVPSGDTLTIKIDTDGPPRASLTPPQTPSKVMIEVSYKGGAASMSDKTPGIITFHNVPLVLTGTPTPSGSPDPTKKWQGSTFALTVAEWVKPASLGVTYVVRHDAGNATGELWWLANPDDSDPPSHSATFVEGPVHPGVHGPFGLNMP